MTKLILGTGKPDSHLGIGWRYLLVGKVDMETGEVVHL